MGMLNPAQCMLTEVLLAPLFQNPRCMYWTSFKEVVISCIQQSTLGSQELKLRTIGNPSNNVLNKKKSKLSFLDSAFQMNDMVSAAAIHAQGGILKHVPSSPSSWLFLYWNVIEGAIFSMSWEDVTARAANISMHYLSKVLGGKDAWEKCCQSFRRINVQVPPWEKGRRQRPPPFPSRVKDPHSYGPERVLQSLSRPHKPDLLWMICTAVILAFHCVWNGCQRKTHPLSVVYTAWVFSLTALHTHTHHLFLSTSQKKM